MMSEPAEAGWLNRIGTGLTLAAAAVGLLGLLWGQFADDSASTGGVGLEADGGSARVALAGVVMLGGAGATLGLWARRRNEAAVRRLVDVCRQIARGDFHEKIRPAGDGTIRGLLEALEEMRRTLAQRERELQDLAAEVGRKRSQEAARLAEVNHRLEEQVTGLNCALRDLGELLLRVRQEGDFGARYENPRLGGCWEIKQCGKTDCSCYGRKAPRCWIESECPSRGEGGEVGCRECPVYVQATEDLVGQVGEAFNEMMSVLAQRHEATVRALNRAEKLSAVQGRFLENLSHEIRTPLNGILGMTELALETELTAEQREFLDAVRQSAGMLLTVIEDILDFSRLSKDGSAAEREDFDPAECAVGAMRLLAREAEARSVELVLEVAPDVPARVVGDAGRLRQVLRNVVGNAVVVHQGGQAVLHLRVERRAEGSAVLHFEVDDVGPVEPGEEHRSIFDPDARAGGVISRQEGSARVGLGIAGRLVEMMGGRMVLRRADAQRTEVHVSLSFELPPRGGAGGIAPLPERAKVLLVEPNERTRSVVERYLEEMGAECAAFGNIDAARAALAQARQAGESPAAVLVGLAPGGRDETPTAELWDEIGPAGPALVIMTGSAGREGVEARFGERRPAEVLSKPVTPRELRAVVARAVGCAGQETPAAGDEGAEDLAPLRVLLVEDEPVNQRLAASQLRKRGHDVTVAATGEEALGRLEEGAFEVVLMDMHMPGMGGLKATREIRRREAKTGGHVPIIAMTAHVMADDEEQCLRAGMDGYVAKPIQASELMAVMARTLREVREGGGGQAAVGPAFDREAALRRVGGNRDLLLRLAGILLQQAPQLLREVQQALADADPERAAATSRRLRVAVGGLCAEGVQEAARAVEKAAGEGRLADAQKASARLGVALSALLDALETEFQPEAVS